MSETSCLVGSSSHREESSKITRVEYWYSIESTVEYTPDMSYGLEEEITDVAESSISWCYQMGGRRVQEAGESYFIDRNGRRLGIMAMNSAPLDQPYDGATIDSCPHELLDDANYCTLIKGEMSLLSLASDELSLTMNDIRSGIREAMDTDALLDPSNPELSPIVRVLYLGDSEDDVIAFGIANAKTTSDDGKSAFVPILAAALVGTGLLALILLVFRRRRRLVTERQLDAGAAIAAASSESSIGDPPGSFHQGYYHYTRDGVRYLSQYCSTCRETESQLAMGHGLETISEDRQFFEGQSRLVTANSKNLGGVHSTMDVHNCASAMCHCRDRDGDVMFTPIPWIRKQQPSDITTSDATDVMTNTKSSKIVDVKSVFSKSEQSEV